MDWWIDWSNLQEYRKNPGKPDEYEFTSLNLNSILNANPNTNSNEDLPGK